MTKQICEIGASSWFYYKEICYDARSHEQRKICIAVLIQIKNIFHSYIEEQTVLTISWMGLSGQITACNLFPQTHSLIVLSD
jgi:hypothetical protein